VRFRRKELPADLVRAEAAFRAVLDEVEPAKAGLADVLPGTRMPGRPLHDALDELMSRLMRATALMPGWRRPELEDVWTRCEAGLTTTRRRAEQTIEREPEIAGFEQLLGAVERLLDPLEPFGEAEDRFRELRR
jgi:hypothetical protein